MISRLPTRPLSRPRFGGRLRTFSAPPVAPLVFPAWRAGVAPGNWINVSGTNQSAVPASMGTPNGSTGPSARTEAWSGYALRGTQVHCIRQGGHHDYYGNEVLVCDLGADSPAWTLKLASSPSSAVPGSSGVFNTYSDGRPAAIHGYYTQQYVPQTDRFISIGSSGIPIDGAQSPTCVVYDPAGNAYLAAGTMPDVPSALIESEWAAWLDPATGNAYSMDNYSVWKWTRTTNTWANVATGSNLKGNGATAVVDTSRNRALIFSGNSSDIGPCLFDLGANTFSTPTITGSSSVLANLQQGAAYCPTTDLFYLRPLGSGGGIYTVSPAGSTLAVTAVTPAGGGSIPAAVNGVYTRWLYIPALGGIAYWPTASSNCWFLTLHD